jgi:hypothetical protein
VIVVIASARAVPSPIPPATKRLVADVIQLSKTSAVAPRRASLVLATSSATVAIGQTSA